MCAPRERFARVLPGKNFVANCQSPQRRSQFIARSSTSAASLQPGNAGGFVGGQSPSPRFVNQQGSYGTFYSESGTCRRSLAETGRPRLSAACKTHVYLLFLDVESGPLHLLKWGVLRSRSHTLWPRTWPAPARGRWPFFRAHSLRCYDSLSRRIENMGRCDQATLLTNVAKFTTEVVYRLAQSVHKRYRGVPSKPRTCPSGVGATTDRIVARKRLVFDVEWST